MMKRAVFLDRDGVICEALPRGEYLIRWDQFKLVSRVVQVVDYLKLKGYLTVVVTNQGQIAKGLLTEEDLLDIHARMEALIPGRFNKVYYCPHHDADNCSCRKPKPGMLEQARKEFGIDPSVSYMIGDSDKDIKAGQAFGAKTIFLVNDFNKEELARCEPDFVVEKLEEVEAIIK